MNNTSNTINTNSVEVVSLYKEIIACGVQPDHAVQLVQAHVEMECNPGRVTAVKCKLSHELQNVQNNLERVKFHKAQLTNMLRALRGAMTGGVTMFRREFGTVDPHAVVREVDKLFANINSDDTNAMKLSLAAQKSE